MYTYICYTVVKVYVYAVVSNSVTNDESAILELTRLKAHIARITNENDKMYDFI